MISIADMTNNIWFERFLNEQGLSRETFEQMPDKGALQNDFEGYLIEKYKNPLVRTPEDEDKLAAPETAERLAQISELPHEQSGYHISKELDEAAYRWATIDLARSGEDMTSDNLQKYIT